MAVNGAGLAAVGAGIVLAYAGYRGVSVLASTRNLVAGKPLPSKTSSPIAGAAAPAVPANVSGAENVSGGPAQQLLQTAAAQHGWGSGTQWQALQNVEMAEAGFNPQAVNSSSGALGLGQALGHGNANTAGSLGNEYGGYGLTDAEAQAANSGDAGEQAVWMCNYIAATYGTPAAAWAHEQAYRWY